MTTIMMSEDLTYYVRATAQLLKLPLGDAQAERVASHLARTSAMAALLDALPMPADAEPAEVYCPAPFPPRKDA